MADSPSTARVLTLVFTDLADSTALKTERGDQAVDELLTRHREHVARLADECAGRIIDWAGDGCFLTFETSSAGVLFALRLQQIHGEDEDLPGVRIGIHLGEVTEKEGPGGMPQVKGLAVDIAARIQGLAKPGQVLLSAAVYQSARQRLGVDAFGKPILWQAYGDYSLKGFDQPVDIGEAGLEGLSPLVAPEGSDKAQPLVPLNPQAKAEIIPPRNARNRSILFAVAAVILAGAAAAYWFGRSGTTPPTPVDLNDPITSLAVLPLDNLSNDQEQEYFADGMTEAITSELAKIKSLKVISRTSAQQYRGSTLSLPEIAGQLNVDGLIEGSVLRDGDDVRITVQLIDARTDSHVWSDSYEDTVTSVLKLQSNVALAIADTLRAELTPDERERIADAHEVEPEAYEVYLQAINAMTDITPTGLFRVRELFTQATQLDPEFADAWAGIAIANSLLGAFAAGPPRPFLEAAKDAAERALELDPTLGEAQAVLGITDVSLELDWESAHTRFDLARSLNPNSFFVCQLLGVFRMWEGDFLDAQEQADRILDLNPYASYPVSVAAIIFVNTGRLSQGLEILKGEVAKNPDNIQASLLLTWGLAVDGDYDAAIAQVERTQSTTGSIPSVQAFVAYAQALGGQEDEARAILERLTATTPPEVLGLGGVPWAYFALGDLDTAFEWLERAADAPAGLYFTSLRSVPFTEEWQRRENLAGVADDPRYWRLIERLKFPPLPPEHPGYAHEQAWLKRKAELETANAPIEKIAVLPFGNMSSDSEQEFFVDGMTEALIAELAKIKSIKVISRTSVMQYKDTDKSLTEIAAELRVDALIEGSVMKAGEEVRITAQLVNGRTDEHLWSDSYTNTLENVFKVQAEVALAITDEIDAVVTADERSRIASAKAVDPRAFELYVQGHVYLARRSPEDFETARRLFESALQLDPEFAPGHAGLSNLYFLLNVYELMPSTEAISKARAEALEALNLDPDLGDAHAALGSIYTLYDWNWDAAERSFARAIELSPGHASAYHDNAMYLWLVGRPEEALAMEQRAYELDPASPIIGAWMATLLRTTGNDDEAVKQLAAVVNLYPDLPRVRLELVIDHFFYGRYENVLEAVAALREVHWDPWTATGMEIGSLIALNREDEARTKLEGFVAARGDDPDAAKEIGDCYAAFGDIDEAMRYYELGYANRGRNMQSIALPRPLRPEAFVNDPRFQDLLRRMDFPQVRGRN